MKRMKLLRGASAGLAALALVASARSEVVVIVARDNAISSLSAEQVAQIYMGTSNAFPGGGAARPLDQPGGSPVRDEFLARVLEKNAAQFKAVWSRLIFSGKGNKPRALAGSAEVKKAVAGDPSALGFIERSALDDSVKAVLSVK
jgi:ABC-type phosphate transport system substrate-binding protein